jgi:3-methyl-2-oxobutanoate hydroxymethyltransferase
VDRRVTVKDLAAAKERGERWPMLTSYDVLTARIFDEAGIPVLLVGDSAANVVYGYDTTLPVTIDEMVPLVSAVVRGTSGRWCGGPALRAPTRPVRAQALESAARFLKESRAHAVKLEGGARVLPPGRGARGRRRPVMAHLGLTPQSVHAFGGYRVQGRGESGDQLVRDAKSLQEAGRLRRRPGGRADGPRRPVTRSISIPTIGIGAGPHTDAQVLVWQDMAGMTADRHPKFVKRYADLHSELARAAQEFADRRHQRRLSRTGARLPLTPAQSPGSSLPVSPRHRASLPARLTARRRCSTSVRRARAATTSRRSPRARIVSGVGTSVRPSRTTRLTFAPSGRPSSSTLTPGEQRAVRHRHLDQLGADLGQRCRLDLHLACGVHVGDAERACQRRQRRRLEQREDHDEDEDDAEHLGATGSPAVAAMVVRTIGTAPRRPAQDRNICSRHGMRNGTALTTTDSGRATTRTTVPSTRAGQTLAGQLRRAGDQAEQHEQPDLCEHATPFGEPEGRPVVRQRRVAQPQPARYTARKPLAPGDRGGEREERQGQRREGVQARCRKRDAREQRLPTRPTTRPTTAPSSSS